MADSDNMHLGFEVTNKAGLILHDSSWIEGVNCNKHKNKAQESAKDKDEDSVYDSMDPSDIAEIMQTNQAKKESNQEEIDDEIKANDTEIEDDIANNTMELMRNKSTTILNKSNQ